MGRAPVIFVRFGLGEAFVPANFLSGVMSAGLSNPVLSFLFYPVGRRGLVNPLLQKQGLR